jgi:hypothetical protein
VFPLEKLGFPHIHCNFPAVTVFGASGGCQVAGSFQALRIPTHARSASYFDRKTNCLNDAFRRGRQTQACCSCQEQTALCNLQF